MDTAGQPSIFWAWLFENSGQSQRKFIGQTSPFHSIYVSSCSKDVCIMGR